MGKCIMCEVKPNQYWGGSFCENCRAIKNIQKKVLEKLVSTNDETYEKPTTRTKTHKL